MVEVVLYGYSVELLQTTQFRGVRNTPPLPSGPDILFEEVEGLLRKGVLKQFL